jgi:hypothetical protein
MADTQPKHKPNEKHTLDEVLKSLKDLVRNEVLDKAQPPAAEPAPAALARPGPSPSMGMGEIISSLEDLLDTDLTFEDKPKQPVAPPPAAKDIEPGLDETPEVIAQAAPPAASFPEEMSDEDIAKALADIELEMNNEVAPTPALQADEPEFLDPDEEIVLMPAADEPAPALELTVQEPSTDAAEEEQGELPLTTFKRPPVEHRDTASSPAIAEESLDEEILAAPAPAPAEATDETPAAIEPTLAPEPVAPAETAPAAPTDIEFAVDFAPTPSQTQPAPPADDDLAPPPWEDDGMLERAEPPASSAADSGGMLGESIELDISGFSSNAPEAPAALDAPSDETPSAPLPPTELIEPDVKLIESETEVIEMAPDTLLSLPAGEIPVLKNIAVEGPAQSAPPPAEAFTLELSPPAPSAPAPSSRDLHQVAVRVIAKLNIELRKAGKPPLDAKTVNRLQQLLKEAMDKKGNEK